MDYKLIAETDENLSAIEQVLINRGIAKTDIPFYLNLNNAACIDPYKLDNIKQAALRLIKAMINDEKIYIQVDSDCDGYTSSALLINYLYRIFPSRVKNNIRYGLHSEKIHGIKKIPSDCTLVITPDSSSNETEMHKKLKDQGIDTIILDHHQATLQDDPAIIVNNQMCDYGNKSLSGVGVVYKFCQVLDDIIGVSYANDFLDLVALGMVADMMDLRSFETKYLIDCGCKKLVNPFFVEMYKRNSFIMKEKINPFTISFYIAPFINAITRTGTDEEKNIIFSSMIEYEALKLVPSTKRGCKGQEELLVNQAIRTAVNVKKRQDDLNAPVLEQLSRQIEDGEFDYGILIIQLENPVNKGLTGLLANQIMAKYSKPTLILNRKIDEETGEITWEGSGRGYLTDTVSNWREFIQSYATFSEGHPFAFGVGFTTIQLENFKNVIKNANINFTKMYNVDYVFTNNDKFDDKILEIGRYDELWGQNLEMPNIVLKSIPLTKSDIQLLGKGTLKIKIGNHKTTCIKFGGEEIYNYLISLFQNEESKIKLTILGSCQINEFNGVVSPQIKLIDYDVDYIDRWGF